MNDSTKETYSKNDLKEAMIAFSLALSAGILIKLPSLFGFDLDQNESFYFRNISLFVLPPLTGYFAWKRQLKLRTLIVLASAFIVALIFANTYPFVNVSDTDSLMALHLPIALWLVVGVAFSGGTWNMVSGRMDFIRFSGELFIYYVLIALGGATLTGFMALIFGTIGIDIEPFFENWVLSCVGGAVIIAAWLVEIKNNLAGSFAPVLAKLFSPLFAIMLIIFLGTLLFTGNELIMDRNVLIAFDLMLIVVLCLLLYSISARDTDTTPGIFDLIQVVLVVSALIADTVALLGILERITELGFTPNRVAALGMNLILFVNLSWSAILYIRFMNGKINFSILEKWQTDYLQIFALWAAIVAIIFPIIFRFK